jgi:hypothetical protein
VILSRSTEILLFGKFVRAVLDYSSNSCTAAPVNRPSISTNNSPSYSVIRTLIIGLPPFLNMNDADLVRRDILWPMWIAVTKTRHTTEQAWFLLLQRRAFQLTALSPEFAFYLGPEFFQNIGSHVDTELHAELRHSILSSTIIGVIRI